MALFLHVHDLDGDEVIFGLKELFNGLPGLLGKLLQIVTVLATVAKCHLLLCLINDLLSLSVDWTQLRCLGYHVNLCATKVHPLIHMLPEVGWSMYEFGRLLT